MSEYLERVSTSAQFLKQWRSDAPTTAVVLGSGLADSIIGLDSMPGFKYTEIPGFKVTAVVGHKNELRIGNFSGKDIAFLRGRIHGYEGNNPAEVVHNIRALIAWGVKNIFLTNAAGCLRPDWQLGQCMVISDQINMAGSNPLLSPYGDGFGVRFQDMTKVYDTKWQRLLHDVAKQEQQTLYSGVYYGVSGPNYETPAEIKMMQILGASAVGMSTVWESMAARHMGANVIGLSCLTNYGAGMNHTQSLNHHEVIEMGKKYADVMQKIVLNACVNWSE